MSPPAFEHGLTGYRRHKCRCDVCKTAQREAMRLYRNGGVQPKVQHGTRSCYTKGCRQPECTQANRDYQRGYMRLRRAGITWNDPLIDDVLRAG